MMPAQNRKQMYRQKSVLEEVAEATDQTLQKAAFSTPASLPDVAKLVGKDAGKRPLILLSGNPDPVPARSTVGLREKDMGREVLITWIGQAEKIPVVTGVMRPEGFEWESESEAMGLRQTQSRLFMETSRDLQLSAGKSSLLLRKDGKIVMKGKDIVSRARRTNKIKGGTIHLN